MNSNTDHPASRRFLELSKLPEAERRAALERLRLESPALHAEVEALLLADAAAGRVRLVPDDAPTVPAGDAGPAPVHQPAIAPMRESAGATVGPYKLLQLIGEGGFGSVFLAQQDKPVSRQVALKIIKLGMDTRQVVARFEQERQALALMDHSGIAKVFDAGATDTGRPYFVMELCRGESIVSYCDRHNLSIPERLELFAQVCSAVQHAHAKGIIHRDIKPSNVLVSQQDGRALVKVIDFGIAKATASKLTEKTLFTEHRQLIGTPEYMSPEQAEGSLDIDTRTDVYALGVLLYELLTGTTPFSSQQLRSAAYAEIQRIIREVEPPKPSTRLSQRAETLASVAARRHTEPRRLGSMVRGELDWIVMKALEKDRQRRYETPSGLASDVMRYLSGEAVLAAPPSAAYRVRKLVRRNRGVVTAGALIAAALVLGLAGTAWQAKRASDRAEAANKAQQEATLARDAEKARADELKKVSDFQAQMLRNVDPAAAGASLGKDVRRRLQATLAKEDVPAAEREAIIAAFSAGWERVNATDAARELIDATILRRAVRAIDQQFTDQPLVDARLRQAMADLYRSLDFYDRALPLQQSALATRERVLGKDHPDTIFSLNTMSQLLEDQGRLPEAEQGLRDALERSRRVLGNDHSTTISCLTGMGSVLQSQGRLAEAETYLREALETSRRALGADDPSTLVCLHFLGSLLAREGKLDEAEKYMRETLAVQRRVIGNDHPDTIATLAWVGSLLEQQEKAAEAEACYREAHDSYRRALGDQNLDALTMLVNVGAVLVKQGKLPEAERSLREAISGLRTALGDQHPTAMTAAEWLGLALQDQGKLDEAEQIYRGILESSRAAGPDDERAVIAAENLANIVGAQARYAEAEPLWREAVEGRRTFHGEEHASTLVATCKLAEILYMQGKNAEVVALMEAAEPIARRAFVGARAWRIGQLLTLLGSARAGMGYEAERFKRSEAELLEAYQMLLAARGDRDSFTIGAIRGLIRLYTAWDKAQPGNAYADKAAEWNARLADPNPSPSTAK